jgi:CHAT domain-containing protein
MNVMRRSWPVVALAGTIAVIGGAMLLFRGPAPANADTFRDLVAAAGARRTTQGRLTGFAYGPLQAAVRAAADNSADLPLIAAAGRAQQAAHEHPTTSNLHAYGVALLLLGKYDGAIANLQAAVEQQPRDAAMLNDLAVAFAERASRANWAADHPRALEYAERARQAGSPPESVFNVAITLERFGLRDRAIERWQEYLRHDNASGWADEARTRLAELQSSPSRSRWRDAATLLTTNSVSESQLLELSREVPDRVPDLLLGPVIGRWAGTKDAAALEYAARFSAAYATATGDDSLQRAVATLSPTDGTVAAARSLSEGFVLLARDRYIDAEPHLQKSLALLTPSQAVLRQWAAFGLGRVRYFRGAAEQSLRDFTAVIGVARSLNAPSLAARALWVRGIVRFTQGQWALSRADYEDAIRAFKAANDPQGVAIVHVNLSILFRFLGDRDEVWQHRMAALSHIPTHQPTLAHGFLITTAVTASLENLDRVALLFLDEAVKNATTDIPAYTRAETLLQRAKALDRLGRHDDAERDLTAADAESRGIDDGTVQKRVRLSWLTAAAQIHHERNPAQAAGESIEAIANAQERGDLLRSAELHLYLGRALARQSNYTEALTSINDGIADFQKARASIPATDPTRLSSFEPAWELFDEAFSLQVESPTFDRAAAFAAYESSRAQTVLDLRSQRSVDFETMRQSLAEKETLVLLHQQPARLLAWIIQRDTDRLIKLPIGESEARRLTDAYRGGLKTGATTADASRALYRAILSSILQHVPPGHAIVIIDDQPFTGLPWSALVDPATNEPAIARWSISVSPSASLAVRPHAVHPAASGSSALVVSAADVDSELPPLSGARAEARQVADLYPHSEFLEGRRATATQVLERMPSSRVIHVSAHAISNGAYPLLSRLVLAAQPNDLDGLSVRDLLQGSRLDEGTLVVLAACSTIGQTTIRGEGAIGMAWGFLAAGASTVIATLWDVDDAGVTPIVIDMHRRLIAGAAPQDALRAAQLTAIARGQDERIWASLQLVGLP